jgi:hypothetical protein
MILDWSAGAMYVRARIAISCAWSLEMENSFEVNVNTFRAVKYPLVELVRVLWRPQVLLKTEQTEIFCFLLRSLIFLP